MRFIVQFFAVFILSIFSLNAQNSSINGIIVDQNSGESIPFANIKIVSTNNGSISINFISDSEGKFNITNLTTDTYRLIVSFLGFQSDTIKNIDINKPSTNINLGKIALKTTTVALQTVEVTGTKQTVTTSIDKKSYKTKDFMTAKGGTAVDVLKKLPSVSVDGDGNIAVRGTTDFMLYVNGKPTQMSPSVMLSQIAGDGIESIDVITVPSAKFEAQGKGGIINISTKKGGLEGLSVSTNGLLGGAPWGHLTDSRSAYNMTDNRYGGGLNLLYNKNNVSLNGGLYYNKKNINGDRTGDARLLQSDGSYYHMIADGERPEFYEYYTANAGIDYKLDKKSTLSGSYFFGKRSDGRSAFYLYHNYFGAKDMSMDASKPEDYIYNPNTDTRYGTFHTATVDYSLKNEDKSSLNVSLLYEHSILTRELDNRNYDYSKPTETILGLEKHFLQNENTPLDGYRLSIGYEKPLSNGHTLGIGLQPQYLKQSGSFSYDTFHTATSTWADYTSLENGIDLERAIYAGYVDYKGAFNKLSFVAGVRLEYTDQTLNLTNPNYFAIIARTPQSTYKVNKLDFFPTVHLSYPITEMSKATFAASQRINRPPTKNMSPFLSRRHFEVYEVGDPTLKPEYMKNVEASFEQKFGKQTVILTGFYRGTDNAIFRVNTVYNTEKVLIRSFTNAGNTQSIGAELNSNLELLPQVKMFLGGSLYHFRVQGDVFGYKENNESTNWSLKGNINYAITKSLKFGTDLDVKSATVTAQGTNFLFYSVNSALTYSPPSLKGWDISIKALDIFTSNVESLNTRVRNTSGEEIFFQQTDYFRVGPIVECTAAYSFNMNGGSKKKAESNFGKEQF